LPDRIYRGRIVDCLREDGGRRRLHIDDLGKRIHPSYTSRKRPWLSRLLRGLEEDGLIKVLHGDLSAELA
jgi:hypothetical protein